MTWRTNVADNNALSAGAGFNQDIVQGTQQTNLFNQNLMTLLGGLGSNAGLDTGLTNPNTSIKYTSTGQAIPYLDTLQQGASPYAIQPGIDSTPNALSGNTYTYGQNTGNTAQYIQGGNQAPTGTGSQTPGVGGAAGSAPGTGVNNYNAKNAQTQGVRNSQTAFGQKEQAAGAAGGAAATQAFQQAAGILNGSVDPYQLNQDQQTQLNTQLDQINQQSQSAKSSMRASLNASGFTDPTMIAEGEALISQQYNEQAAATTSKFREDARMQKETAAQQLMSYYNTMQQQGTNLVDSTNSETQSQNNEQQSFQQATLDQIIGILGGLNTSGQNLANTGYQGELQLAGRQNGIASSIQSGQNDIWSNLIGVGAQLGGAALSGGATAAGGSTVTGQGHSSGPGG